MENTTRRQSLEQELGKKDARIGKLEKTSSDLEKKSLAQNPSWPGIPFGFGDSGFVSALLHL
jgi:hypothetical protein